MATEIILPKLGQTMEDGSIIEWFKQEGDPVKRGEALFTVESDKATLEVEAPGRGFLRKVLVPAGQLVPVLTVVALMTRTADESLEDYALETSTETLVPEPTALEPEAVKIETKPPAGRIFSSPRARKLAREKNIDLALVTGTGPGGRIAESDVSAYFKSRPKATPVARRAAEALGVDIAAVSDQVSGGRVTKADVEAAAQPAVAPPTAPVAPAEETAVDSTPLTGLRRIIAERMATSVHTTARVTLATEADATALVEAREGLKATVTEGWGFAPGYNDLLAIMAARALREFPYMNARLSADGQTIERVPVINLGIAVDTERGLLVPVIRNADQKGLRALGTEFRTLMERARSGKSMPDDLSGGTFTITNLGVYEIDAFTPIINLPEAAILGVGRIQPKPVARNGEVVVRQMCSLSLAFDHRLVDGVPAARFLQGIKRLVENPYLLLE